MGLAMNGASSFPARARQAPAGPAARPALRAAAARGHSGTAAGPPPPRPSGRDTAGGQRLGTNIPLGDKPSAPGTNHPLGDRPNPPLWEPRLAQGTSAAAACPVGSGMKTRIAALTPAGKAARSPRGSAASRCSSCCPVGSRSFGNVISHCGIAGSEALLVPGPNSGAGRARWGPGALRDRCPWARPESFQH